MQYARLPKPLARLFVLTALSLLFNLLLAPVPIALADTPVSADGLPSEDLLITNTGTPDAPEAIDGNGTRPIVLMRSTGSGYAIHRMDTDGTNLLPIYGPAVAPANLQPWYSEPFHPTWSPNGTQIAFSVQVLDPVGETSYNKVYFSSLIGLVNANGSNVVTLFKFNGRASIAPVPLSCQWNPYWCTYSETPSINAKIISFEWSPTGQYLAAEVETSSITRYGYNAGTTRGGVKEIYIIDVAGRRQVTKIEDAQNPSWSNDNRLLFESFEITSINATPRRPRGIWEANMSSLQQTRILATNDTPNSQPTWLPNNQQFLFIYNNYQSIAIIHRDLQRYGTVGTNLVTLNGATVNSKLAVAPDGTSFVFSARMANGVRQVMRYDFATRRTTPLTNAGDNPEVDWAPTTPRVLRNATENNSLALEPTIAQSDENRIDIEFALAMQPRVYLPFAER